MLNFFDACREPLTTHTHSFHLKTKQDRAHRFQRIGAHVFFKRTKADMYACENRIPPWTKIKLAKEILFFL